jgi:hypothetical protein
MKKSSGAISQKSYKKHEYLLEEGVGLPAFILHREGISQILLIQ